jgi:hypothetical protein
MELMTQMEKKIISNEMSWLRKSQSAQGSSPLPSFNLDYLLFFICVISSLSV